MSNESDTKCAGCGETYPCTTARRTDVSGRERAKHVAAPAPTPTPAPAPEVVMVPMTGTEMQRVADAAPVQLHPVLAPNPDGVPTFRHVTLQGTEEGARLLMDAAARAHLGGLTAKQAAAVAAKVYRKALEHAMDVALGTTRTPGTDAAKRGK